MEDPNVFVENDVRVQFVELGEGLNGDYNPDDPNDVELLRFDVYVRPEGDEQDYGLDEFVAEDGTGSWVDPGGASYCTNVPVTATPQQRRDLLVLIHGRIGNPPTKLAMQQASWFGLDKLV